MKQVAQQILNVAVKIVKEGNPNARRVFVLFYFLPLWNSFGITTDTDFLTHISFEVLQISLICQKKQVTFSFGV